MSKFCIKYKCFLILIHLGAIILASCKTGGKHGLGIDLQRGDCSDMKITVKTRMKPVPALLATCYFTDTTKAVLRAYDSEDIRFNLESDSLLEKICNTVPFQLENNKVINYFSYERDTNYSTIEWGKILKSGKWEKRLPIFIFYKQKGRYFYVDTTMTYNYEFSDTTS